MRKTREERIARLQEIKQSEQIRIELISAYAPYLVPLIPAILSYFDMTAYLTFGTAVPNLMRHVFGVITGFIIEFLGIASGNTYSVFLVHNNDPRTGKTQKAPVTPVVIAYAFYIVLVLVLNVVLPWEYISRDQIIARIALSLMSIPANILITTRSMHAQILFRKEVAKLERQAKKTKPAPKPVPKPEVVNGRPAAEKINEWLKKNGYKPEDVGRDGEISPSWLADELKIKRSTVRTTVHRMKGK